MTSLLLVEHQQCPAVATATAGTTLHGPARCRGSATTAATTAPRGAGATCPATHNARVVAGSTAATAAAEPRREIGHGAARVTRAAGGAPRRDHRHERADHTAVPASRRDVSGGETTATATARRKGARRPWQPRPSGAVATRLALEHALRRSTACPSRSGATGAPCAELAAVQHQRA